MALFSKKKSTTDQAVEEKQPRQTKKKAAAQPVEDVLIRPRITEKAAIGTQDGVYVFNVRDGATKSDVATAIKRVYKVIPRKVNTTRIPRKSTFQRGVRGTKGGGMKAYVYLKKGDKIDLM